VQEFKPDPEQIRQDIERLELIKRKRCAPACLPSCLPARLLPPAGRCRRWRTWPGPHGSMLHGLVAEPAGGAVFSCSTAPAAAAYSASGSCKQAAGAPAPGPRRAAGLPRLSTCRAVLSRAACLCPPAFQGGGPGQAHPDRGLGPLPAHLGHQQAVGGRRCTRPTGSLCCIWHLGVLTGALRCCGSRKQHSIADRSAEPSRLPARLLPAGLAMCPPTTPPRAREKSEQRRGKGHWAPGAGASTAACGGRERGSGEWPPVDRPRRCSEQPRAAAGA
jgi:hypothetical protein